MIDWLIDYSCIFRNALYKNCHSKWPKSLLKIHGDKYIRFVLPIVLANSNIFNRKETIFMRIIADDNSRLKL